MTERLSILHIENVAGVAWQIAQGQRALGHKVDVLETFRTSLGYPHNIENYANDDHGLEYHLRKLRTARIGSHYDVIHVHYGWPKSRWDYLLMRLMGKPVIVHYHGDDAYQGSGMHYKRFASSKIVATPDLLKLVPDAHFIPNPIELWSESWPDTKPRIIHMPTNRVRKGTDIILNAIELLRRERGDAFDFVLVEKIPRADLIAEFSRSHILIDQVVDPSVINIPGLMGMVSFEAMSMGKVSVCHIDPEMLAYYPGCPVVNVGISAIEIKDALAGLLDNMSEARKIGLHGREYIAHNHSPLAIAKRIQTIYDEALG